MNREILFRGKRIDNGEWVEGYYFIDLENKKPYIMLKERMETVEDWMVKSLEVIPETVGQFIGLLDKNGKGIFEGDIDQNNDVVMWCKKRNGWAMKIYDFPTKEVISCHCYQCDGDFEISDIDSDIEVIGNIHDKTK